MIILSRLSSKDLDATENSLRQLRLYHWRQFKKNELMFGVAIGALSKPDVIQVYKIQATMHLKTVQLLNDVIDGTAETDEANEL